jgi:hypothetical protein
VAATASRKQTAISPGDYAAFIGGLQLEAIWLKAASVQNEYGPRAPADVDVAISDSAGWEGDEGGFAATQTYTARLESEGTRVATIEATFGLQYSTTQPMTAEIFALFRGANLPVNAWPYFREFVSSAIGRMGWEPLTLPAFKLGVASEPPRQRRSAPRARRQED